MTVLAIVQARTGSTRLPGKVLKDVHGEAMLTRVLLRARAIDGVDDVVVATSDLGQDDPIAAWCAQAGWSCERGSEQDVLDRYYRVALAHAADHVVRITADCPLLDYREASAVVRQHLSSGADYTHNLTVWGSGMPLGTGVEIFTMAALTRSWHEGHEPHHREHVDEYVGDHPELFHVERVDAPAEIRRPDYSLTVDTAADLASVREIYAALEQAPELITLEQVVRWLDSRKSLP